MSITKKDEFFYGTEQGDIREVLADYAKENDYEIHQFKEVVCTCGNNTFTLDIDDNEGVAGRICTACEDEHLMLDGEDYVDDAELYQATCNCEAEALEITIGVSLYKNKKDLTKNVRWLYIGCRCPECHLMGCYADWKNEHEDYQQLLENA